MLDRHLSPRLIAIAGSALVIAWPSLVQADDIDEIQRRDLSLIQTQIEQIRVVVDRIADRQRHADPATTRIYFDIPRLRADLLAITRGIDSYLAPGRSLPRDPTPLAGDYLDDRGQ